MAKTLHSAVVAIHIPSRSPCSSSGRPLHSSSQRPLANHRANNVTVVEREMVPWGVGVNKQVRIISGGTTMASSGCRKVSTVQKAVNVGRFRCGFSCQEGEDEGEDEDEDEDDNEIGGVTGSSEPRSLPPWGNCDEHSLITPNSGQGCDMPSSGKPEPNACSALETKQLQFLEETDEMLLSKRILGLSKSNRSASALKLFVSMDVAGIQPTSHASNSLLACLLRNGFINDAFKVFDIMTQRNTTTSHTYSLILKKIAISQGSESAIKMFSKLQEELDTIKRRQNFDSVVYNTMITIYGEQKNWVQIERTWRNLKDNGHKPTIVTYRLLITFFARCCQPELAFDAYHEMLQNGIKPTEPLVQALITACTKEGKWDLGLCIFQSMFNFGLSPTEVIYNSLIDSLGKAKKAELAFMVFNLMKSSEFAPNAYTWNALIGALNRENRYGDALQLFESIKKEHSSLLNPHLFNAALMSCQKLGLWDRSLQILWQMEEFGFSISTLSYNLVISACEVARKPKVALQVYQRMIHKNCVLDTFTYVSLARACIWGSLWPEVEEILDRVPGDAIVYNTIIQGMCLKGKMAMAKKLYLKMRKSGLKADGKTRALMIQNLTKASVKRGKERKFDFAPSFDF